MKDDEAYAFKCACVIQVFTNTSSNVPALFRYLPTHLVISGSLSLLFVILQRLLNNERIVGSGKQKAWGNKKYMSKFGLENKEETT